MHVITTLLGRLYLKRITRSDKSLTLSETSVRSVIADAEGPSRGFELIVGIHSIQQMYMRAECVPEHVFDPGDRAVSKISKTPLQM